MNNTPLPVPCILGPTGAGKTAASLGLAAVINGSIINADSRQIYQDFPIITAQPTIEEQQKALHHMYGYLPTTQSLGAGQYAREVSDIIKAEHAAGRVPILVGGTGLYIKTLFSGVASIPDIPQAIHLHWQNELDAVGSVALHKELERKDPVYAAKIHPHDKQRIARALEVLEATGHSFSWWHAQPIPPPQFRPIYIGIQMSLQELEPRLKARIDIMLKRGAIEEAKAAYKKCPDHKAPGWSGIGCAELLEYITGATPLEACCELWLKNTRAYAKRQITWFRPQKDIQWFAPADVSGVIQYVQQVF